MAPTAVPDAAEPVEGPPGAVPRSTEAADPREAASDVPPGAAEETAVEAGAADDRRFTVRLVNFEGPFDLLLQLISRHKLDVTEVALSKVTDEFMAHIRAMGPDWDLDQTTEFLVVAATLLDLKAARLLPTAEVEDEADLALWRRGTCSSRGSCSTARTSGSRTSSATGWSPSPVATRVPSGSNPSTPSCSPRS